MLSIIILTKDEEENLPTTLRSIAPLCATVFVVDSGSSDRTVEIAAAFGCHVVTHAFQTQAQQVNWALDALPLRSPWIMRLDADERVTSELVTEILDTLASAPEEVSGFELKRRVYFWGRWIKHGGYYPTWLFRIWRRGTARSEQRWMDEHMVSTAGRIAKLLGDIIDENQKGLTFWVDKHNRYADREVKDLLDRDKSHDATVSGQAGRRRWLKNNVYSNAPLFSRAIAYWAFRYFIRLGFLDGVPGLVFHLNQGLWYRLLVDAKIFEQRMKSVEAGERE